METASTSPSWGERGVTFYLAVLGTLIVTVALGLFALYSAVQSTLRGVGLSEPS